MKDKILNIVGSPRFWALFLALVFLVTKVFWVTMPLDESAVTGAVVALVAFIASVSASSSPTVWSQLFKEFKFWTLVVSLVFVFIRAFWPAFPLTEEQVLTLIGALSATSIGVSYRPINTAR